VIIGAAGMMTEMAVASIAAVVWASTGAGSTTHAIAYNLIFVGSVSTLLFNANPLLRYDGYYILSDILEIPNLAQRSRDYLYFLVRRWVWGVKQARDPAHTRGERIWMVVYAVSSTIYRVFICVAILLFISSRLPFLGALLAVAAIVAWVLVPLGRFAHYLAASSELMRVRTRAVASTLAVAALAAGGLGLVPAPDRTYVEGVVEPVQFAIVYAAADGFLRSHLPSGSDVSPDGPPLVVCANPDLEAEARQWEAQRRELLARRSLAATKEVALVQTLDEQIRAVDDKLSDVRRRLADLAVHAPFAGKWLSPQIDLQQGAYLRRGTPIGVAATPDRLIVRAVAGQEVAGVLSVEADPKIEMRIDGRPDALVAGTVTQFLPAGQERVPSPALTYAGGGSIPMSVDDQKGTKTAERVFEIRIAPDPCSDVRLLAGQRVIIRFDNRSKPLIAQWKRSLLQLIQRRFKV